MWFWQRRMPERAYCESVVREINKTGSCVKRPANGEHILSDSEALLGILMEARLEEAVDGQAAKKAKPAWLLLVAERENREGEDGWRISDVHAAPSR